MTLVGPLRRAGRQLLAPGAAAAPDLRTLRDIGAPEDWLESARRERERQAVAGEHERLRARGAFGA